MDHAHGFLQIKGLDLERRVITGIATTPTLDRQDHILDPLGVRFKNPIPLLLHHDRERPIGRALLGTPTAEGISFEATIPEITEPGPVKDRVDEAWASIKAGLLQGVSIGFRVMQNSIERIKGGGFRLNKTEVCELSLVTVPANADATILTIKALDAPFLAALGPEPARVEGLPVVRAGTKAAPNMNKQTTAEQITAFENTRAAKSARMVELMDKAAEGGSTFDDAQTEEYDGLKLEVKAIDAHLVRLRDLANTQIATATAIAPVTGTKAADLRGGIVSVKANVPLGTAFTRMAMAIAASGGNKMQAVEIAKQWHDSTPEVEIALKAAVTPGSTTDPVWAGALVTTQNITSEFLELLRPATILGKIPNLRQVPFNASVPIQTAGGSYGWVGQGAPKRVTKLGFGTATLAVAKAAGIIVLTEELVRLSNPSAEAIVRADMIAGIAAFLDQQFIDPAVAAVANISPASITNGLTPITSVGPLTDLQKLVSALTAANIPLAGVALIMSETNAFALGLMRDANGNRAFPTVSASGGTMEGVNVVTSNAAGNLVILVQPRYVLYADDGGVAIDVSREASVQMDSAPANPADATTVLTSLWQNNLVGLRAERFINWKRGLDPAVAFVTGAIYNAAVSPSAADASGSGSAKASRNA